MINHTLKLYIQYFYVDLFVHGNLMYHTETILSLLFVYNAWVAVVQVLRSSFAFILIYVSSVCEYLSVGIVDIVEI